MYFILYPVAFVKYLGLRLSNARFQFHKKSAASTIQTFLQEPLQKEGNQFYVGEFKF